MLTVISGSLILGHNFWLVAKQNDAGESDAGEGTVRVEANTGHHFPTGESAVSPSRVADGRIITINDSVPPANYHVEDKSLVFAATYDVTTAAIIAITLNPHPITLEADKFKGYIDDEDARAAVAPYFQADVTAEAQREVYTKYAKAFIAGHGAEAAGDEIFGRVVGHKLEIILDRNPATLRHSGQLSVQLLFDGKPGTGLRVSSGGEQVKDGGYAEHRRTDEDGRATISITAPGRWYIRSHHIRPHPDKHIADWESFWTSLTFQIKA